MTTQPGSITFPKNQQQQQNANSLRRSQNSRSNNSSQHSRQWTRFDGGGAGFLLIASGFAVLLSIMCGQCYGFTNDLNLKPTKYTEWSKNVTYVSSTDYNARGMKPLYEITQKVMWFLIGGEDPIPDGKSAFAINSLISFC